MKNPLHNFRNDALDEVVFANRNKAYGAYVLRNEYSNLLSKALFIGISFFASLAIAPLVINAFNTDIVIPKDDNSGRQFIPVDVPEETPRPQPTVSVPQNIKTVKSPTYVPTRDVKKEEALPTKKDFEGAAIGSETRDGDKTDIITAPPINVGPSANVPYTQPAPPAKVEDPNRIVDPTAVDISAEYKGGINAFRQKVGQYFDTSSVSEEGMVSGVVTFVVEKDGSISNIKVNGENNAFNKEAERAVKSIKTKWKPAQLKGQPVRSSFRMPISMRIE